MTRCARGLAAAGAFAVAAIAVVLGVGPPGARAQTPPERAPTAIVLVVTDDQRFDTLWAMPTVTAELVRRGASFPDAFVVNPICCPSRATILTGRYSHTTGVYRQVPPFGRFEWFRDGSTLATWLQDAGYTTGLFGKYLDGYQHAGLTGYIPPGWDRWAAFIHSQYEDYALQVDGEVRRYGSAPEDYSTDVLAGMAEAFVRETPGPLFLYFAPAAPHGPAPPAPGDEGAFADLPPWRPPSYDEVDVSDKPAWVRDLHPLGEARREHIDELRRNQYASLLAVDRAVAAFIDALRDTGRLADTLFLYTSDNGLLWGEHRWRRKEAAYEEAIRVPLVVRWDAGGIPPGSRPDVLAANVDLAPTIADAVGIPAPGAEGISLLPTLRGEPGPSREDLLIEHLAGANPVPTYCAVRSRRWTYVRYEDGFEELYDLQADPYQLQNLAGDPDVAEVLRERRARLAELCDPPPPGYADASGGGRTLLGVLVLGALLVLAALRAARI
jgi:N-acetylglucosamine-6-sulfatase